MPLARVLGTFLFVEAGTHAEHAAILHVIVTFRSNYPLFKRHDSFSQRYTVGPRHNDGRPS
jgi:hypothetical protein